MRTTKDLSLKDTAPFVLLEFSVSECKLSVIDDILTQVGLLGTKPSNHIQYRHGHIDYQLLSQD